MRRHEADNPTLPPRIQAAFDFLHHARMVTDQVDPAVPVRELTPLERSVETAALRALQQYLLGEMDFREPAAPPPLRRKGGDDDDCARETVSQ